MSVFRYNLFTRMTSVRKVGNDLVDKKLRCYIYTRVSTNMQVDGYSLDAKRDNYNIGSESGRVPICPPEKEKAILGAFKHFGMI